MGERHLRVVGPDDLPTFLSAGTHVMAVEVPERRPGPKPTKRVPKPFTPEEWVALMRVARPDVAAALVFLRETGMRSAEALSITAQEARGWPSPRRWRRFAGVVVKITGKGSKERLVLLSREAVVAANVLLAHPRPGYDSLIPWSLRGLRYVVAEAGKAAGVHAHPHRARHTYATEIAEADVPLEVLADMLGHASVNTSRLYYRSSVTRRLRAMKARRRYLRHR